MSGHNHQALKRAKKQKENNPPAPPEPVGPRRSSKIRDRHLDRLAIVYVRQSSPQQVLENRESRERQYALSDFAKSLGWSEDRVLVIDEDQGQSGKYSENRTGFQRLLTEVSLDHVGLVLGLELNRLSRSNKDWHHLVEVCAVFDTLLGDQDGLYDANDCNDRLLLGMKGAMSEFELITLRNRLDRGRQNKADRGELFIGVPIGYLKLPSGEVVVEPDEQARGVVQLIFDKFRELGTARGVFLYLIRNGIRTGFRVHKGPNRSQLEWRRSEYRTILRILRHPIYTGAYAYGFHGPGRKNPRTGRNQGGSVWLPPEEIDVLLPDRLPAYISWEDYLANQERLAQNRSLPNSKGSPRRGSALLGGIIICGSCGRHLRPVYSKSNPRYMCNRYLQECREQTCYGLTAAMIDELVSQQVLRALKPAALELSLRAAEDVERDRKRIHRHWKQQLQRARYEAQRVERQYQAVDPENRLVARTLEARWEESLSNERKVREEYDRFLQETPEQINDRDRAKMEALAGNIAALWHAPGTTASDRKEIIRCLIDRVVVHVREKSEYVDVTIHWHGGFTCQHEIVRPVKSFSQLRDYDRLLERVEQLHQQGNTAAQIAANLNDEGFVPPRRSGPYGAGTIRTLLYQKRLVGEKKQSGSLEPGEWRVRDLARELGIIPQKVYYWIERGWIHSRRSRPGNHVIVWADRTEIRRLKKLKTYCKSWALRDLPELTTPKPRNKRDE